jgi:hypothetical protein
MEEGMRFGTWNVRSVYRPGLLTTVARELARYNNLFSACTQWCTQDFFSRGSTNSVEGRGQRERGPGAVAP